MTKQPKHRAQKRFKGKLWSVEPSSLIKPESADSMRDVMLSLSLIYNDLHGLLMFASWMTEYEKPTTAEATVHSGIYGGLTIHLHRLSAIIFYECMELLREKNKLFRSDVFQKRIASMDCEYRSEWDSLVAASLHNHNQKDRSEFADILYDIRNNVAAHYSRADTALRQGYVGRFFEAERVASNEKAFMSDDGSLGTTRMLFVDAAVGEYIDSLFKARAIDVKTQSEYVNKGMTQLAETLYYLLKAYFETLEKRFELRCQ